MVPAPEAGLIVSGRSRTTYPRFVPTADYFAWRDRERRAPKRLDPEELQREKLRNELRQEVFRHKKMLFASGELDRLRRVYSGDMSQGEFADWLGTRSHTYSREETCICVVCARELVLHRSEVEPGMTTAMHAAHGVAWKNGGPTTLANLFPTCAGCNEDMGTNELFSWVEGLGAAVCLCKAWRDMRAAAWKP